MAVEAADPLPGAGAYSAAPGDSPFGGRWGQLILGVLCMSMIANLQYGWTLFVNPINDKYQWGKPAIQIAFTIFVLTETWLVPIEGWFVDKYGPKVVTLFGGALCAIGWAMNSDGFALILARKASISFFVACGPINMP